MKEGTFLLIDFVRKAKTWGRRFHST